jgi:hypothetical protein
MSFVFTKTPKRIINYSDIIKESRDPGWVMVPLKFLIKDSHPFRFPDLLKRNNDYKWSAVDDYFRSYLLLSDTPMHYGVEKVGEEWDIHVGSPECNKSWWLKEMADNGIISSEFRNCKLVAIFDNYEENIPENRMFRVLWHKLFSSWIYKTGLNFKQINWIDDIINWEVYKKMKVEKKIDYTFFKSTFFNKQVFDIYRTYYRKNI